MMQMEDPNQQRRARQLAMIERARDMAQQSLTFLERIDESVEVREARIDLRSAVGRLAVRLGELRES
jgi:hypothetical protein